MRPAAGKGAVMLSNFPILCASSAFKKDMRGAPEVSVPVDIQRPNPRGSASRTLLMVLPRQAGVASGLRQGQQIVFRSEQLCGSGADLRIRLGSETVR